MVAAALVLEIIVNGALGRQAVLVCSTKTRNLACALATPRAGCMRAAAAHHSHGASVS